VGKPEGKGSLRSPCRRWEDNVKMDVQEVRCGGMESMEVAQERDRSRPLLNAVVNQPVS
jgi:hypothetical protein